MTLNSNKKGVMNSARKPKHQMKLGRKLTFDKVQTGMI